MILEGLVGGGVSQQHFPRQPLFWPTEARHSPQVVKKCSHADHVPERPGLGGAHPVSLPVCSTLRPPYGFRVSPFSSPSSVGYHRVRQNTRLPPVPPPCFVGFAAPSLRPLRVHVLSSVVLPLHSPLHSPLHVSVYSERPVYGSSRVT